MLEFRTAAWTGAQDDGPCGALTLSRNLTRRSSKRGARGMRRTSRMTSRNGEAVAERWGPRGGSARGPARALRPGASSSKRVHRAAYRMSTMLADHRDAPASWSWLDCGGCAGCAGRPGTCDPAKHTQAQKLRPRKHALDINTHIAPTTCPQALLWATRCEHAPRPAPPRTLPAATSSHAQPNRHVSCVATPRWSFLAYQRPAWPSSSGAAMSPRRPRFTSQQPRAPSLPSSASAGRRPRACTRVLHGAGGDAGGPAHRFTRRRARRRHGLHRGPHAAL